MYGEAATIESVDTFLDHISLELRRARNQVVDTTASAVGLAAIAAVFALGVRELTLAPSVKTLLQPTLLLLQFLLVVLAIRAITLAIADYRELAVLTSEFTSLSQERDALKERDLEVVVPVVAGSIIISSTSEVARPGISPIVRGD